MIEDSDWSNWRWHWPVLAMSVGVIDAFVSVWNWWVAAFLFVGFMVFVVLGLRRGWLD